jgi:hypothetical protein
MLKNDQSIACSATMAPPGEISLLTTQLNKGK